MPFITLLTSNHSDTICKGDVVTCTEHGGGIHFHWNIAPFSPISFYPPTSMILSVLAENGACFVDTNFLIIVDTFPEVHFRGDTSICLGQSTTIYVAGGYSYLWSTGSTNDSIHETYSTPGKYTYYVTVTRGACHYDSAKRVIDVKLCTGIPDYSDPTEIEIYPNPSGGMFILQIDDNEITGTRIVEIYNVMGQKVYTGTINSTVTEMNLSNQPNGVYFYRVLTQEGSLVGEGKIVIAK